MLMALFLIALGLGLCYGFRMMGRLDRFLSSGRTAGNGTYDVR